MARSSYHGVELGNPNTSPGSQHWNIHTILKKVFNFLVAKLGYEQPKSGSPSKF